MEKTKSKLLIRKDPAGYEVWSDTCWVSNTHMVMENAYTLSGDFIGTVEDAEFLCGEKSIRPEKLSSEWGVCSIGFCEKENKWYGWSHRAISGFGIGHEVSEEEAALLLFVVGFKIKSLGDAKRLAIAFAESVS